MRRLILFATTIIFLSCSKSNDDHSEKQLTPNYQNMVGTWKFSSIVRPDGTVESYIGSCATNNDNTVITANTKITTNIYYSSCNLQADPCENYYFEGNQIKNCLQVFNNARVTSLTSTTMKIEYDEARTFGPVVGVGAKAVILTK